MSYSLSFESDKVFSFLGQMEIELTCCRWTLERFLRTVTWQVPDLVHAVVVDGLWSWKLMAPRWHIWPSFKLNCHSYIFIFGSPCYGLLQLSKKVPLTSITWPYRWPVFRAYLGWVIFFFFKLSSDQGMFFFTGSSEVITLKKPEEYVQRQNFRAD